MNQNYLGSSGIVHSSKFVDLNGRLVTVMEEEYSGEIYVSLTELKKSGFELFEAGTFPNPGGYLNHLTELQINQFEMYLRMKAAKYLSRTVLEIRNSHVDDIINEQKEHFRLGQNSNRTVSYNSKGNFSITTKVDTPVKVANNFERNGNRTNYNNRENSNPNQLPQLPYQRSNNYRTPNTERNKTSSYRKSLPEDVVSPSNSRTSSTRNEERKSFQPKSDYLNHSNSYRKSSHEEVVSPSNSRSSFTRTEERKPFQPKGDYANTKQQPRGNSSFYSKPEPISDKLPSKPQNSLPLSPVPPSETMQNSQQKRVSNSDNANSSSIVSSTPVPSPVTINEPKARANTFTRKGTVEIVSQGGMLECLSTVDDTTIVAYVVPVDYTNEFAMLADIAEESQINLNFAPAVGDMIAVFYDQEDTYVRGIVHNIMNSNYTCSLIDFGVAVTTTNIRPLLKKFIEIPEFACYITGSAEDINEIKKDGNIINVEITSPGNLTLEIEQTKRKYKVQAKVWNPLNISVPMQKSTENIKPMQAVFKVAEDKNLLNLGDMVIISSGVSGSLIVRTRHCDILLKQVAQAIEKHQGEALTETPVVNQLVLCPYSSEDNGSLYRAEVLSVDGQLANVRYVDYGDFDRVPISAFKNVNETLANMSNTYIKITLQEFGNKIFTTKQNTFLQECFNLRKKLTAIGTDDPQVFDLLFSDKTSLSKTLIDLEKPPAPPVVKPIVIPSVSCTPSSKASTEEKKYSLEDLPESVLEIGLNEVICTYSDELSEGVVTFCPATAATSDNLLKIADLIADHIEKDKEPYQPALLELCIAKFEDDWYRGVVLGSQDGNVDIYFVDYGNPINVRYEFVRRISPKLATFPVSCVMCMLKDVIKEGSDRVQEPMLSKLKTQIKGDTIYQIDVIEKKDNSYSITIPEVYENLKKEGLL